MKLPLFHFAHEIEREPEHDQPANPEPVCADCGDDLDTEGRCKSGCAALRKWQDDAWDRERDRKMMFE